MNRWVAMIRHPRAARSKLTAVLSALCCLPAAHAPAARDVTAAQSQPASPSRPAPSTAAQHAPAHSGLAAQVDAYRLAHESVIVGELDALTRLKSIAADPAGLSAAAHHLEDALRARGFRVSELDSVPGAAPAVFGYLPTAHAKRTVVYYAHYDGQPVTPSQWSSDPFQPVMRAGAGAHDPLIDWQQAAPPFDPEWRIYGRAVSDDKASIAAFLTAFDALKALHKLPTVNIKVLWEGEEEAGSIHLPQILHDNPALLAADLFLIGDGPVHQSRRPMVFFGARGEVGLEATVYGPNRALHDGHYGNWVPNPAVMAANLIAQMRDDDGNILIPGFSDDVRPLTADEQRAIAALPPIDAELKRDYQIGRSEGSDSLAASLMRPALNIRGIRTGQVGEAAANAIPPEAQVSFDFRLVPDQTPAAVRRKVEQFLQAKGWTVVSTEPDAATRLAHPRIVRLQWEAGYPALRSDMSSPAAKAVILAASKAAGAPVVVMPMSGGSVPLYTFADNFHVPIICLPIVNHDNNQHAANENLRLQNLWDGIDVYAALLAELNW
jgi:acetylornithine deacetylase/succinyl-diaminopimelate desuccinylase-like protein